MSAAAQLCSICIDQTLEFSPAPVATAQDILVGEPVAHSSLISPREHFGVYPAAKGLGI
jgi:hypothetical protein